MFEALGKALRRYAEKDGRGYPDWALRYVPVARGLRHVSPGSRVLEIGANENGLARFTPIRPIVVDVSPGNLCKARAARPNLPVCADAGALPFADCAFDAVVSMDTLEHVPRTARQAVASEIVRVLRDGGVGAVSAPTGRAAAEAEREIQARYEAFTRNRLLWLAEHEECGLPEQDELERVFADAAGGRFAVRVEGNAPLWVWRPMWRVLICGWPGHGNALAQVLLRFLTPLLTRLRWGRPYRTIVWLEPQKNPEASGRE